AWEEGASILYAFARSGRQRSRRLGVCTGRRRATPGRPDPRRGRAGRSPALQASDCRSTSGTRAPRSLLADVARRVDVVGRKDLNLGLAGDASLLHAGHQAGFDEGLEVLRALPDV